jgi:pyridoxal biosynthesis lyase PdxS
MGLLDKVKASAEQAASSAQKQAQIVATKRELSQAYGELGKTAFGLVDRGELGHGDLAAGVDHIRELQARLSGDGPSASHDDAGDTNGGADIVE